MSSATGFRAFAFLVVLLLVAAPAVSVDDTGVVASTPDAGDTSGVRSLTSAAPGTWTVPTSVQAPDTDTDTDTGDGATGDGPTDERRSPAGGYVGDVDAVQARIVDDRDVDATAVRVGVLGSEFDADHPAIAANVATSREFGPDSAPFAPGAGSHDTAVAEIVADTAPESRLYLASLGTSTAPGTYQEAVEWLLANDVDVIVDAGSYFPVTHDGSERITAAAEGATSSGVVFVTSAGNYAQRHWRGNASGVGWVEFSPDVEANFLEGGDSYTGVVSLRLRWNSTADYDLYLYRRLPGGRDPVVAKSASQHGNDTHRVEAVDVAVPTGRYYVAVRAESTAGNDTVDRVDLFSPRVSLQYASGRGGVTAPATSDRVISVAAVDAGGRATYSSWSDDRLTVDLGAPGVVETAVAGRFVGTSAAAPYVAGTAALMQANNANLTPADIQYILEATAREHGRVDALAAIRAVSTETPLAVDATGAVGNDTVDATVVNTTGGETASENVTAPANVTTATVTDAANATESAASVTAAGDGNTTVSADAGGSATGETTTSGSGTGAQSDTRRNGETTAAPPARRQPV